MYRSGITNTPSAVAAIMPPNTAVPTPRRVSMATPVAKTSGARPSTKARLVIMTGRMRMRAPAIAASSTEAPRACSSMANSTIKIAFLLASAMRTTMPIWAKRSPLRPLSHSATIAPKRPIAIENSTASGMARLS